MANTAPKVAARSRGPAPRPPGSRSKAPSAEPAAGCAPSPPRGDRQPAVPMRAERSLAGGQGRGDCGRRGAARKPGPTCSSSLPAAGKATVLRLGANLRRQTTLSPRRGPREPAEGSGRVGGGGKAGSGQGNEPRVSETLNGEVRFQIIDSPVTHVLSSPSEYLKTRQTSHFKSRIQNCVWNSEVIFV